MRFPKFALVGLLVMSGCASTPAPLASSAQPSRSIASTVTCTAHQKIVSAGQRETVSLAMTPEAGTRGGDDPILNQTIGDYKYRVITASHYLRAFIAPKRSYIPAGAIAQGLLAHPNELGDLNQKSSLVGRPLTTEAKDFLSITCQ